MNKIIFILIGFGIFFFCLIFGFINNLIYLMKVKQLLKLLYEQHLGKVKELGLPESLGDCSIQRTPKLLEFLKSSDSFGDSSLQDLKMNAYRRLQTGYLVFGTAVVDFLIIVILLK